MKEYIDREAACAYRPPEKCERRYSTYNLDDAFDDGYDEHIKQVEAIPAADVVEVRKGRWIQHYVGQERTPWGSDCSVCGEWLVIDRLVMQEKYHYCPNCGAKMTEDHHEQKE